LVYAELSTLKQTIATYQDDVEARGQDHLLEKFPKRTLAHWCVIVFAVSFLILAVLPETRLNDSDVPNGAETVRVARSLASSGTFADPFPLMPTGTTAHVAPVYPFLYSLVIRMFGTGYTALRIVWTINLAFFALQMALLPVLSYRLHLGVLAGIVAAALGTFSLYAPIDTRWESFFAGTLLLVACLLSDRVLQDETITTAIIAGGLWGVLILTNPVVVLLLLAWPLCLLLHSRPLSTSYLRRLAIILGLAMLIVSPWIARNYQRFGVFIFVRDNLGLELYTGNNSCAAPDLRTNIQSGCHATTHPNVNSAIAAQVAAVGEVQFYRAKMYQALDWIGSHRAAFLRLTAERLRLFWFPDANHLWEAILAWIVTLLSIPGLWVIAQKNPCAACVIGTAWLLFPLVYYMIPFEPRYRYPIYWTSLLASGCALAAAWQKLRPARPGNLANRL
jgi:hypothetical protein